MPGEPSFEPTEAPKPLRRPSRTAEDGSVMDADIAHVVASEQEELMKHATDKDLALSDEQRASLRAVADAVGEKKLKEFEGKETLFPSQQILQIVNKLYIKYQGYVMGELPTLHDLKGHIERAAWRVTHVAEAAGKRGKTIEDASMFVNPDSPEKLFDYPIGLIESHEDKVENTTGFFVSPGDVEDKIKEEMRFRFISRESVHFSEQKKYVLNEDFQLTLLKEFGVIKPGQSMRDLPKLATLKENSNGVMVFGTEIPGVDVVYDANTFMSLRFGKEFAEPLLEHSRPRQAR